MSAFVVDSLASCRQVEPMLSCRALLLLVAAACHGKGGEQPDDSIAADGDADTDSDTDADADTDSDSDSDSDTDVPGACERDKLLAAPLAYTKLGGFTSAEDFTFDDDGHHVALNDSNHLVAQDITGDGTIIATSVVAGGAGIVYLSDGSFAINDAYTNAIVRVYPDGTKDTILSGLAYPNGLEVDPDDFLYVAENGADRVRRVDPTTGEYTVIAEHIPYANGVAFGPGYTTLYVGAFGGGTITAIPRGTSFEEWGPPYELANSKYFATKAPCAEKLVGDSCTATAGGAGTCTDVGAGYLACRFTPDDAACAGKSAGDACTTELEGASVASRCVPTTDGHMLYCPRVRSELSDVCDDSPFEGSVCTVPSTGSSGKCMTHYEGLRVCVAGVDEAAAVTTPCGGHSPGDVCHATVETGPYDGTCADLGGLWLGLLQFGCKPPWVVTSSAGYLDGINVDECGTVYATDYATMDLYRIFPDATGETAIPSLPSSWIPNAKWARHSVGGWSTTTLYVADRPNEAMFAVEVGVRGKQAIGVE
jgi:sugar lactone lactonase YvrE